MSIIDFSLHYAPSLNDTVVHDDGTIDINEYYA